MEDGCIIYMRNSSTALVNGKGTIELDFNLVKMLTFKDTYLVPKIKKLFLFGSLLNKHGFKLVFESDKFVLIKGDNFVEKGYLNDGGGDILRP